MGRTAYDFERHAQENIRTYVRQFELPRPDPMTEKDLMFMLGKSPYVTSTNVNKSHENFLMSRHERWRTFENIRQLSLESICPLKWTNVSLPQQPVIELNLGLDARYMLPSVLPEIFSHAPTNIENMRSWLSLLLVSATRVLHCTLPRTQHHAFQVGQDYGEDKSIFRHFVWSHKGINLHEPMWGSGSVVVAYQPPFILTQQDLQEFVACRAFPTFDLITTQLSSKHRLWAKMWDTCQATKCNWFILTSYTHWVFGAFSKGMRVVFTSPVITYSKKTPTILEYFMFWICSAMGLPGTFHLPQVDEPVFAEHDIDMEPVQHLPRPPASESFWEGRDELPESSAGVDLASQIQGEGSIASCFQIPERSQTSVTKGSIKIWLATCENAAHRVLDEDDLVYNPIPAWELLENTFREDDLRGEWMIPS